ncbi:hypothetical protein KIL84_018627, partial [Mauremys mutica]
MMVDDDSWLGYGHSLPVIRIVPAHLLLVSPEAQFDAAPVPGLTDPRLCYILDGILFIYAVIITALFLKAK